ncbi:MAG TPA: Tad domain-containing protein [Candidatus Limnocylindria bacterium]
MKVLARPAERGQVLVIVAMGMVAIVAMVGLVIDGGYAWVRQRDTQNGADAVAKAGTIVVQYYLAGDSSAPNDYDVACAAAAAAASNGVDIDSAEYVWVDSLGAVHTFDPAVAVGTCTVDLGVAIPTSAQGVKAQTSETFETFLMPVIGVPQLTAIADAIAVVGESDVVYGGALPVTFPETSSTCDRVSPVDFTIRPDDEVAPWEFYEIIDEADADGTNLAIVPLCDIAPGSVGWLDWDCGQNLQQSVADPCDVTIPIPAWVQTQTGNVNALEDELNTYAGPASEVGTATSDDSVLALPIHDFTCDEDVPDPRPPSDCPSFVDGGMDDWSGNGNNLYYHIPWWVGFKLDQAYTGGDDPECGDAPGSPLIENPDPPGKVGCLKGWFVDQYTAPGSVSIRPIAPGEDVPLQVVLVN